MKQRLFTKFFFATGALIVLSLTVTMLIMTVVYNNYIAESKYKTLQKTCDSVSEFIEKNGGNLSNPEFKRGVHYIMHNLTVVSDYDVYITDSYGVINVCSCTEWTQNGFCKHTNKKIDSSYLTKSSNKQNLDKLTTLGFFKEPHYVSSAGIVTPVGDNIGYVVAAAPMSAIRGLTRKVVRIYLVSAIIPLIIMFAALYVLSYRFTRPLKLMSSAAKAMAKGDFSRRIPVTSDDEIGELAVSFNQMTNSLSRLEGMRKSFVADVSHELKTPMTTIGGFIDGILDGTIEKDKQSYYLTLASNEVKRLSRMVESMLSISRLESAEFILKPEIFDIKEVLLSVVLSQERRIEEKKIEIKGLDTINSLSVNADKDLLYRVIYNLVDNAIKFTNENGKIEFNLFSDSKNMIFTVTNTGKGIKKSDIPYLFERFYKTDKSRSENKNSTGLGLYIVKTIIKKHGGNITVSSVENEHVTFKVALPLNLRQ